MQLSIKVIGSPKVEALVDRPGGTADKSRSEHVKILPLFYKAACAISSCEKGELSLRECTYDGCSSRQGGGIASMTFHYVDRS